MSADGSGTGEVPKDLDNEIAGADSGASFEVPAATGAVALEGATQDQEAIAYSEAPATVTRESLVSQLPAAWSAYSGQAQLIKNMKDKERKSKETVSLSPFGDVAAELETWLTDDILADAIAMQEADPSLRFTLVATPNVTLTYKQIEVLARKFAVGRPGKTWIFEDIYKQYTPEELSGTTPENGNSVVFSLVPSKLNPALYGIVSRQRDRFSELQRAYPHIKVPSVLEALTYIETLLARREPLNGEDDFDKTCVHFFNLPEKSYHGSRYVPYLYIDWNGNLCLNASNFTEDYMGRAAIA